MTETPLVDAHVHVFTSDMPLVDNPRHAPTYDFTVEQFIATMDAHGVAFAVIAAASPWGDYNDYTIAALRAHPRLRGTVILKPTVERYILDAMSRDGVDGVRLPFISLTELPDITTFDYRRFLRRLADLDWHVHLHVEGDRLPPLIPTSRRPASSSSSTISAGPIREPASTATAFRRCCDRSTRAAPGSRCPPATGWVPRRRTTRASSSASPAPTAWCGQATARSSGTSRR